MSTDVDMLNENQKLVIWISATFTIITAITISIRLWGRWKFTRYFGADDFWIVLAFIFSLVSLGLTIHNALIAAGKHIRNVDVDALTSFYKNTLVVVTLYPWWIGMSKISILSFYLRIFPNQILRKVIIATYIFVFLETIGLSLYSLLQCIPIARFWNFSINGQCIDEKAMAIVQGVIIIMTNFWIVALSVPALSNMQIPRNQKIKVVIAFAVGLCACIISIIRAVATVNFFTSPDPTYDMTGVVLLSSLEGNIDMVAASIPALQPVVDAVGKHFAQRLNKRLSTDTLVEDLDPSDAPEPPSKEDPSPWDFLSDGTMTNEQYDTLKSMTSEHSVWKDKSYFIADTELPPPVAPDPVLMSRQIRALSSLENMMKSGLVADVRYTRKASIVTIGRRQSAPSRKQSETSESPSNAQNRHFPDPLTEDYGEMHTV